MGSFKKHFTIFGAITVAIFMALAAVAWIFVIAQASYVDAQAVRAISGEELRACADMADGNTATNNAKENCYVRLFAGSKRYRISW